MFELSKCSEMYLWISPQPCKSRTILPLVTYVAILRCALLCSKNPFKHQWWPSGYCINYLGQWGGIHLPAYLDLPPVSFPDTLYLRSQIRMKDTFSVRLMNFTSIVKFSQQYLFTRGLVHKTWEYSILESFKHVTVEGVRKIRDVISKVCYSPKIMSEKQTGPNSFWRLAIKKS